jgi:ABC-type Na+ efflux pump permease subunit
MTTYETFAKILIALGVCLILIGVIVLALSRAGVLGKLPGDIHVEKKDVEVHFPLVTCMIASIALSFLLTAFFLWSKR